MMTATISTQQLLDASRDADDLGAVVNNPSGPAQGRIPLRLGGVARSIAQVIADADARFAVSLAYNYRGPWQAGVAYSIRDQVLVNGIVYLCIVPNQSSAAFQTDLTAGDWVVYQGMSADGSNVTVPAAVRFRGGVSPSDYNGASTTVLAMMQWAADYAMANQVDLNLAVPIAAGAWQTDGKLYLSRPNPNGAGLENIRVPKVIGGNCNIVYVGNTPLDYMISIRDCSNNNIEEVRLNGQNVAKGAIDGSYTTAPAPSLGNVYRFIAAENFAATSANPAIILNGNNDSDITDILVAVESSDPYAIGLMISAPGGAIRAQRIRNNGGELVYQAQTFVCANVQSAGLRAIGNDDNELTMTGCYLYASKTGVNIRLPAARQIMTMTIAGRIENGYTNGRIIAGDNVNDPQSGSNAAYLNGGLEFYGTMLATGGVAGVKLFDDSVLARNGPAISRVGGRISYVDISSTASQTVRASVWDQPHADRLEGIMGADGQIASA